jgi:8-oxo-dGTP diphosphatase
MSKNYLKKSAGIIFTDGSSILLLLRAEGKNSNTWGIPGGKSEDGETEFENAIRETKEELGISAIPGEIFDSISHIDNNKKYTTFFYKVREPFDVNLNHEHSEYAWVKFKDLNNYKIHPILNTNIHNYLSKIKKKACSFEEWLILKNFENKF